MSTDADPHMWSAPTADTIRQSFADERDKRQADRLAELLGKSA